jgi:PDZ domain
MIQGAGTGARVLVGALLLVQVCGSARAALVVRSAGVREAAWPAGTTVLPLRMRGGQLLLDATLVSPSGTSVSGVLILDTGAPGLHLVESVWRGLKLDTLVMGGSFYQQIRRPIAVELGGARFPDVPTSGVIADSLLPSEILGLLGPSVLGDRALVIDWARGQGALVPPRLALVARDSSASASNLGRDARVRRSRVAYAAVIEPGAVAVPFRLFEGGRMLVTARMCEGAWCSASLNLLLDTGASSCVCFDDVVAERAPRARAWPTLRDLPVHTMLGTFRMDAVVAPRIALTESEAPLAAELVDVGITARRSLPDLDGALPERVHGLLGATFLERFRLVLDVGNQVAWFAPARVASGAPSSSSSAATPGLRLERRGGALRVAAVAPGSPAATAGAAVGDEVVSIDGVSTAELDGETAAVRLAGRRGTEVVVVTRREGWQRVLRLERVLHP